MKNRLLFSLTMLSSFIPVSLQAMSGAASTPKYSTAFSSSMDEKDNKAKGMTPEEIKKFNDNQLPHHADEPKPIDTPAAPANAATQSAQTQDASTQTPMPPAETNKQRAQEQYDQKNLKSNIDKALAAHALKNCPERIKQAIGAVQRGKDFKNYRRFLLVGPSGTGKTTIAQAIANECKVPLMFYRAPFIADRFKNDGEQNLKAIFEDAFAKQPCVIVIDELNILFEKHNRAQDNDQGMLRAMWSLLDETEKHKVIFIGTCNYLKDLPREIATRFPAIIKIDLPSEQARKEALDFHIRHHRLNNDIRFDCVDTKKVAQKTNDFSLRDIESLVQLASFVGDDEYHNSKDKLGFVNTDAVLRCIPEILEQRYNAIDKTSSEWKEYVKTALQYGFQVATFAGQMAFQKWMQDQQFKHADNAQSAQFKHGENLHKDGKLHQADLHAKQNSWSNVISIAFAQAVVSGVVSYFMPQKQVPIPTQPPTPTPAPK